MKRFLPYLLIAAVVAAVFWPSLSHRFVCLDDPANVSANPIFTRPQFKLTDITYFWREPYAGLYIPVTYTFWGSEALLDRPHQTETNQSIIEMNPRLFHAGNLLLHLGNTLLVYVLLRRFVPGTMGPLLGAMLFAVHPLHVETVAWVTESKGLLAAAFSLLAYLQFLDATDSSNVKRQGVHFCAATLLFVLAMLSKPTAISLPWIVAAIQFLLRRHTPSRLWAGLGGWFVLGLLMTMVTHRVQSQSMLDVQPTGVLDRVMIAGDALAFYFVKVIYPVRLVPDYGRSPQWVLTSGYPQFAWIVPVAVVFVAGLARRRAIWLAALAVFILGLAPVLGLIPFGFQAISTVADRYTYFALLGPSLALAALVSRRGKFATLITVAILIGLSVQSYRQTLHWSDDLALFGHTLTVNVRSVLAANAMGNAEVRAGNLDRAVGYYEQAIESDPTSAEAWFNLARVYEMRGEPSMALSCCQKSLEFRPGYQKAVHTLARLLVDLGEFDAAVELLEQQMTSMPNDFVAGKQLASIYVKQGALDDAITQYQKVIALKPDDVESLTRLAAVWGQQGNWEQAVEVLAQAAQLASDEADNWFNLGTAQLNSGQADRAVVSFRQALKIRPEDEAAAEQLTRALEASKVPTNSSGDDQE